MDPLARINEELRLRAASGQALESTKWLPLESNPELLTSFSRKLGLPNSFEFVDVLGLDEELLRMVPSPVLAVVLLFPCTQSLYSERRKEEARLREEGRTAEDHTSIFFLTQVKEFGNGVLSLDVPCPCLILFWGGRLQCPVPSISVSVAPPPPLPPSFQKVVS